MKKFYGATHKFHSRLASKLVTPKVEVRSSMNDPNLLSSAGFDRVGLEFLELVRSNWDWPKTAGTHLVTSTRHSCRANHNSKSRCQQGRARRQKAGSLLMGIAKSKHPLKLQTGS